MKSGKVSENILKRSVLGQIGTRREEVADGAGAGRDCAIFSFGGEGRVVTCMQEAALTVPGRPMGIWAGDAALPEPFLSPGQLIIKCANNLAAGGAEPVAVMLTLLLPPDAEERELRELMAEAAEACRELDVELMGGQTRVTGQVGTPYGVAAGYGRPWSAGPGARKAVHGAGVGPCGVAHGAGGRPCGAVHGAGDGAGSASHAAGSSGIARPGEDVVLSKCIGLQGTALLAKGNRQKLLARYPGYLVEEAAGFDRYLSVLPEARAAAEAGVCAMHDASEGGIFGALWELAERSGVGLDLDMRKLPLRQETVEVCECCGVNPYELLSGGCLLMTARDGPGLLAALRARHIPAAMVGKVTGGRDRILRNGDEIRCLDKPQQDQILIGTPAEAGRWEQK